MKVLFIANRGEIGGAHTALENTIINLKKMDYDITLLTPNKNSKWFSFCNKEGIKCKYIKYYEIGYAFNIPLIRRICKYLFLPVYYILNKSNYFSAKKIMNKIDIDKYDYIHTNTNRDDFGLILSKMYKIKHIMHLREFDKEFFEIIYLKRNFYNYIKQNTFFFISVSDAIKTNYIDKGIDSDKIITIYDGVDNNKIIRKKEYCKDKLFKIVMVSNICEEKGQLKLIDAVSKIKTNKMIKVDFYGAGSTEYIRMLKKHIMRVGLNDNIAFKGYEVNIKKILHNYDLAIMCSKIDGFGLVTVEYMMAGVPVLVSNTGANFEIVKKNITGFMFDYYDNKSIEEKILYIINNYNNAIELANNAYEYAIDKFSLISSGNYLNELYERGLKSNENKS